MLMVHRFRRTGRFQHGSASGPQECSQPLAIERHTGPGGPDLGKNKRNKYGERLREKLRGQVRQGIRSRQYGCGSLQVFADTAHYGRGCFSESRMHSVQTRWPSLDTSVHIARDDLKLNCRIQSWLTRIHNLAKFLQRLGSRPGN
ncbi:unnamed protein product [Symbiodinium natans]|uniref:Uncharacterized protein n=1 Tax=Symbiodinium natans TaxID=878477 RepID=A0A812R2P2_9DINO|nr:unnamed protein product [Symbiodinium natans]